MDLRDDLLEDATKLQVSEDTLHDVKSIAEELLCGIAGNIDEARLMEKSGTLIEMPSVVKVNGLSNKDTQRLIYASLVRALEKKNYTVSILFAKSDCYFCVKWHALMDTKTMETCRQIIDSHVITK